VASAEGNLFFHVLFPNCILYNADIEVSLSVNMFCRRDFQRRISCKCCSIDEKEVRKHFLVLIFPAPVEQNMGRIMYTKANKSRLKERKGTQVEDVPVFFI